MTAQLGHKALTEPHDLVIALALGIEVGTALSAAHGKTGKAVLEDLLKAQELEDGQVHGRMEPQAPLVRPNGGAELNPIAPVDLDLPLVVHPRHPEGNHPFRLHKGFNNAFLLVFGTPFNNLVQALQNLQNGLMEFALVGVTGCNLRVNALQIIALQHIKIAPSCKFSQEQVSGKPPEMIPIEYRNTGYLHKK